MKNRKSIYLVLIVVIALCLAFFDLPSDTQKKLVPFTPQLITDSKVHLGLDLQGGAQLDYKVDLKNVPNEQRQNIIDGILNVINKRVNSLGVSEPNIYTSDFGDEKHIIVELAGIKDLEKAKETVGKTIQLEFKQLKANQNDPNYEATVKAQAQALADKVKAGGDLKVLGQEEQLASPEKVAYKEVTDFKFKEDVDSAYADKAFALQPGQTTDLIENAGNYVVGADGKITPGPKSFDIVKVTDKRDQEKEIPRSVNVSHILISYKGAQKADSAITRTQDEAKAKAQEVISKLNAGGDFAALAKEYSDDKGSAQEGGKLSEPAVQDGKTYVKEFNDAAFNLKTQGELSQPVLSPFGYHVIKADKITEASKITAPQIKYIVVTYSAAPDPWESTGLNGQHFVRADVQYSQTLQPYVSIQFNDEGSKLFEEITRKNVGKPLAIFVGGQLISAPNVNEAIAGGNAQITGQFTLQQANDLARDLNTGAIPAPIVLAGQYTIGATLGQDALQNSLAAGFIGFVILALFMILYYRLPGLIAVIALSIYSAILLFLIKSGLPIIWALLIGVALFIFLVYKVLQSRESGPEKAIASVLSIFVLFFVTFVLSTPIVLTLAGIAGVILSIGMAVDANILIFERIKEELRDGRSLGAAIEVGFDRAWNSIRDSNFSSLITCAILFYFGSSIIQGFAFNLAAGILVSMFTAITVTKVFLEATARTRLGQNLWLFNAPKNNEKRHWAIIPNRKKLYVISVAALLIALIGIPVFGIRLGLDFTGGTFMEINPQNKQLTIEQVKNALKESNEAVNKAVSASTSTDTSKSIMTQTPVLESSAEPVDLTKNHVVPTDKGFDIKIPHINNAQHDELVKQLTAKLGQLEESRFTTIGPTVGQSLQYKAIFAVIIASIMIIVYIALAFRKIPKYVGKWRFGVTAVIALLHDLGIMLGVYVYLGAFLGVEVDALFITALLTILGFSVHDTIVVFDRLREKLKYQKRDESFEEVANQAVNETIARSINTSLSTFIVLCAMFLFGAPSIKYFILSLMVGIVSGTYSSIFIATPLLVDWQNYVRRKAGAPVKK